GPITGADPAVAVDGQLLAPDLEHAAPCPDLGEARSLDDGACATGPHEVGLLLHSGERSLPRQVAGDAVLGAVANEPQAAQRLQHLDPVRTHALIETIV